MTDLFQYTDYRKYLSDWIAVQPSRGRGMVSALAKASRCQPAYISRMLQGRAQLSLEQAFAIQKLLKHSRDEISFFILLVEWDRAGDAGLKSHFLEKIEATRVEHSDLQNRFKDASQLTQEHQRTYYSSFQYTAIHLCITVPALQTVEALEEYTKIPRERVESILEFLLSAGLAVRDAGRWKVGQNRLHLARDSTLIRQHHSNWRIEALKSLDRGKGAQDERNLHYSAVVSLSEADAVKLKEHWTQALEEFSRQVAPSKEETVRALVIDFFSLD